MTDAQRHAAKERKARRCIRIWKRRLGLQAWQFTLFFHRLPDSEGKAYCIAEPEYRTAKLGFDLERVTDVEIEGFVRHEVLHCLIWSIAKLALDMADEDKVLIERVRIEEETLTTLLDSLPVWRELDETE